MKKIIQLKLKILSKLIIAKYKPEIIGVTGSVGKTSTKEAIYTVLKNKYNVRRNIKNFNNEIGLPLTIIGKDSPAKSIFGWALVFLYATKLILLKDKNYPKILVLEMGVDRPGDMEYLTSIVKPDIGVVTLVGTVHVEYFDSLSKLREEKAKLIKSVKKHGFSIINYDNEGTKKMINESKSKVLTFGLNEKADVRAQEIIYSYEKGDEKDAVRGISFKLGHKGSFAPILLPGVLGHGVVYAALAGAAVGISKGMNLIEIADALREIRSPKGRTNLLGGIKRTMIIDDTYNSEPESALASLEIVEKIGLQEGARKFAVLGDMLELGKLSVESHRQVGEKVVSAGINKLVTVGERSRDIDRGAEDAGMKKDDIFHFADSEQAGLFVQDRIKMGDLILVKGSQGVRMEKIVKEIMADPLHAKDLLVRQTDDWEKA